MAKVPSLNLVGEMKDERKTKTQLIIELAELRQRLTSLEISDFRQRQEEELFHIFRIASPVGLFITQDGKFQFVNDVFHSITGASPDELLGTDPTKHILPEDRNIVRENAIKMLSGERLTPYKYRLIAKDGQTKWMLEGVISVQYQGRRSVLGHAMDTLESVS